MTTLPLPVLGLSMIVKNEERVIRRCLESVRPFITHWVISDTGSTDNTKAIIQEVMSGIPGILRDDQWQGWGVNRTIPLAIAREHTRYTIGVIDADEVLEVTDAQAFQHLTAGAYYVTRKMPSGFANDRLTVFNNALPWRFEGKFHEGPEVGMPHSTEVLGGVLLRNFSDGASSGDALKEIQRYTEEALHFEEEVAKDPSNTRAMFYLAQSYRDSAQVQKAHDTYLRRASMGGFPEEIYISVLYAAHLRADQLGSPMGEVAELYLRAHALRPQRAEALYSLGRYYRMKLQSELAEIYARMAVAIPLPASDRLFVEGSVYAWRAKDELGLTLTWTGKYEESLALFTELLAMPGIPDYERPHQHTARDLCLQRLGRGYEPAAPTPAAPAKELRLNLGCGNDFDPRFTGVDLLPPAEVEHDLSTPWPWPDQSVASIRAHNVVQYLADKIFFMNEAHRVLKPGGMLEIVVPTTNGEGAFADPMVKSYWNGSSFAFFLANHPARLLHKDRYGITALFSIVHSAIEHDLLTIMLTRALD